MNAEINTAGIERMKMPAIDFKTYAANRPDLDMSGITVHDGDMIIFTGASGDKRAQVLALNEEIMACAGMANPERANTQFFGFRSIALHVAGVIVPRDQLDTCMRAADIEVVTDPAALQGKVANAVKLRKEEFAEAREVIAQRAEATERAACEQTTQIGHDFLSRLLHRLDRPAEKDAAATR